MRYHWIRDQVKKNIQSYLENWQAQFGRFFTKTHPGFQHLAIRGNYVVVEPSSNALIPSSEGVLIHA